MGESRRYRRAPITEAVIEFRVEIPQGVGLGTLARVQASEKQRYPVRQDRWQGKASFSSAAGASVSQKTTGYAFLSQDKRQVFQARTDGFSFSRLAPYDRWETFRDEARRLWDIYRSVVHPKGVRRIGVRYINRLDLPVPIRDFADYLRTVPQVSPDLPQGLNGFFMQVQIPQPDLQAALVLNQAMMPPENPKVVSIILDIDLYREESIPERDDEVWSVVEEFRSRKNAVFEACVTAATRELID